jgi:hypothetical protein
MSSLLRKMEPQSFQMPNFTPISVNALLRVGDGRWQATARDEVELRHALAGEVVLRVVRKPLATTLNNIL